MQLARRCIAGVLLSFGVLTSAFGQSPRNYPVIGEVIPASPKLGEILDPNVKIEVVASGFAWTEGPLWIDEEQGGYLLFSDIPKNSIMKWKAGEGTSLYMKPSGYTGVVDYGREPGSNGLLLDKQGRLVCCEHGDRRVSYLTKDGGKRTLCDNYQGKRFNSPNDAALKSNGDIYFTDPPWGLPKQAQDPRRELDFCGVYRVMPSGEVTLLTKELALPNGIAFSPDEKTLYVTDDQPGPPRKAQWHAFPVLEDGTLGPGKVFYDCAELMKTKRLGGMDGLKLDVSGNLWATSPSGVLILSPTGELLGQIVTNERVSNCAFGGPDRSVLYITSDSYVCRIQTKTKGVNVPSL